MSKTYKKFFSWFLALLFAVFAGRFTQSMVFAKDRDHDEGHKVYVCKYVGTPGVDERLQTGSNPIEVDEHALPNGVSVGSYFSDQQGRSYVLATVPQFPEPTVDDCPDGDRPTHLACSNNACTVVEGAGENTCRIDADCEEEPIPVLNLKLTSMCWENDATHRFRVRNTNSFSVAYDYKVVGVTGWISGNVATVGDSFFTINGTYGQANTTKIRWQDENQAWKETTKAVNQNYCEKPEEPTPAPTPVDVCANIDGIQASVPDGLHLDASGRNCVSFSNPGVPEPEGGIGGGEVLGTSTMAATGVVESNIFYSIFSLGSLLTSLGIMKNGKKRN